MKVNIIGGGLAGCALAYALKQAGAKPVIYEAGPALGSGASGNDVGLYNPRLSAELDISGKYYSTAFQSALRLFEKFDDPIDWNPCGTLFLMNDEKKKIRYKKTVHNWGWNESAMRIVDQKEASEISGITINSDALYLPRSGYVSPKKLCQEYTKNVDIYLDKFVEDIDKLEGDVTILSSGMGCLRFKEASHLPLTGVRGQVTYVGQTAQSKALKCAVGYGGYITPAQKDVHYLGATFQRWLDHNDVLKEDDGANIRKLCDSVPSLDGMYEVISQRAAVRTSAKDYFPVVGQLGDSLYISTAHGSYGILSTLISANILTEKILDKRVSIDINVLEALSPVRFSRV